MAFTTSPVLPNTNKPVELAVIPLFAKTDTVPVVVIGPPFKPLPVDTEVTPWSSAAQYIVVPLECNTSPAAPIPPFACNPTAVPIANLEELAMTEVPTVKLAALIVPVVYMPVLLPKVMLEPR